MITHTAKKESNVFHVHLKASAIETFSNFLCQDICLIIYIMCDLLHSPGVVKLIPQKFDAAASKLSVFCNKKPEYTTGVIMTL